MPPKRKAEESSAEDFAAKRRRIETAVIPDFVLELPEDQQATALELLFAEPTSSVEETKAAAAAAESEEVSSCSICQGESKEVFNPRDCSVCFRHMCGASKSFKSVCTECWAKFAEHKILQKDEQGRHLDPATRIPLKTCICGKPMMDFSECMIKGLRGDPLHKLIPC